MISRIVFMIISDTKPDHNHIKCAKFGVV